MAIGVVSLVIVAALLPPVVAHPARVDSDCALLRSRSVVIDKVDELRLWKGKERDKRLP